MPNWLRGVLAVTAGLVAWFAAATVGNLAIRSLLPGYAEVEKSMDFTLAMQVARLLLGASASIVAGVACALVAREARWVPYACATLLFVLFVPVHISLWSRFPTWYHLVFLGTLVPIVIAGARLVRRETPRRGQLNAG